MRRVVLLLALTGCSQIFGLEAPHPPGDASLFDSSDAPLTDAHQIDTQPGTDAYVTVTFQQGSAQYTETSDCYLDGGTPNQSKPTDSLVRFRSPDRFGLLQFQSIFSTTAIPAGSTILSARLDIYMNNVNCTGHIADVAIAWADSVTYNTFGPAPGVNATDLGTIGAATPTALSLQSINVTDSLNRWSVDPTTNHGWIFVGDGGAGDCNFRSSEDGTTANRPKLVVTFQP